MHRLANIAGLVILSVAGCGQNTSSGPGPLDGTWQVSSITCNGQAADASGAGVSISGGKTRTYVLDNLSGSETIATTSCTVTYPVTFAYPSTGQIEVTYDGNPPTCQPAGCDAALCATAKGIKSVYTYALNGLSSVTWTSAYNTDLTCSIAVPFQDNPVGLFMNRQ